MAATVSVEVPDREDTASGLLAALVETNAAVLRGEVERFRQAAVWADLHPVKSITDAAALPGPRVRCPLDLGAGSVLRSSMTETDDEGMDREQLEQERRERLDEEHRPDGAAVDNTDRDFDETKGMFTDSPGYEEAEERFPPASEQDV